MSNIKDTQLNPGPASSQASSTDKPRVPRLVSRGLLGAVAAAAATTVVAALAKPVGVEFEISDGGETIPLSGIAFVTGIVSVAGVVIAAASLRWNAQPAKRFVQAAVSLTAISLIPPFLSGAAPSTVAALVALHLVAAAVMIPTLARSLHTQSN
ncbi:MULTISPECIES: DUF6069 family protein [unclassified Knoellia]|uniref:DUF6069 family protein n=1 Tax=Knoellia altitudinis TaxID=3404795 RepID=UPI003621EF75